MNTEGVPIIGAKPVDKRHPFAIVVERLGQSAAQALIDALGGPENDFPDYVESTATMHPAPGVNALITLRIDLSQDTPDGE